MRFDTISQIKSHQFVGNFMSDQTAFRAIYVFVSDTTRPIFERAEALRILGRVGMGLTPLENLEHLSDEARLQKFIDSQA